MRWFYTKNDYLQYFTAGNLVSKDGFVHQDRIMNCDVLIFVMEGTLFATQSEQEFSVCKGQYILLRAGEHHFGTKSSDGRLSYLWVHFKIQESWEELNDLNMGIEQDTTYLIAEYGTSRNFQRVGMLFKQLIDFSRQTSLFTEKILTCSLSLILMEITQQIIDSLDNTQNNISPLVYEVSEWIKSNCHKHHLTAGAISNQFSYNHEYLSTVFKKQTGFTLTEFLNKSRIEVSKNLLSSNNISIKEAAYSSGFNDEKYYMKLFRKQEGITPLQYKNAFHKNVIISQ